MKRLLALSLFLLLPVMAYGEGTPQDNVIKIMSGTTIAASGTSTYIIDLNSKQFGYRPGGDYSIQFKGFRYDALWSGATVSASWRACNALPTGVTGVGLMTGRQVPTSKMASTSIVSGLNILTGNTEYAYGFFTIDTVRYMLIDVTAGVSTIGVTAWVKVD